MRSQESHGWPSCSESHDRPNDEYCPGEISAARSATAWYDQTGLTLETGTAPGSYLRDPSGLLLSVSSSGSLRNYGHDRLGSVTGSWTTANANANLYRYDPWGVRITNSGSPINPFKFTGGYHLTSSGLFDFGARTYFPERGRFTQADPLPASITDLNRHAYAGCNPANFVDPTGTQTQSLFGACVEGLVAGAIAGAVTGAIAGLFATPVASLAGAGIGALAGAPGVAYTMSLRRSFQTSEDQPGRVARGWRWSV